MNQQVSIVEERTNAALKRRFNSPTKGKTLYLFIPYKTIPRFILSLTQRIDDNCQKISPIADFIGQWVSPKLYQQKIN